MTEIVTTIFDTETTGFPNKSGDVADQPYVVQLAAVQYLGKRPIGHLSAIINHEGVVIPEQASNIHKITTDIMAQVGMSPFPVLDQFNRMIIGSDRLVAHNMSFDDKLTDIAYHKLGFNVHRENLQKIEKVCTMAMGIDVVKKPGRYAGSYGWPKLIELYQHLYGKPFTGAHDAMVDVRACAACYFKLIEMGVKPLPGVNR